MSEETYNGWTNRETWAVALHINNDQGWQESVQEAIREKLTEEGDAYSFGEVDDNVRARWAGDAVKDSVDAFVEEMIDADQTIRVLSDIGSLWRVNWTELGASFLEDMEGE